MKIVNKNVNDLIPYVNNPRLNDNAVDAVASSIKNFGFKVPIVIDSGNEIVTGHTRLKAAKKLGLEEVPCIIAKDLSHEQIKAFRLADNKTGEIAHWDFEALAIEIEELQEVNFNLEDFGFEMLNSFKDLDYEVSESADDADDNYKNVYADEEIIDDAYSFYKKNGFPYPNLELFESKQQINKLASMTGDTLKKSTIAYKVADTYNKHRFEGSALNMKSPLEAFNNEKDLKKALKMELPNIKKDSLGFINLVNGTQANSNFRPAFCKYVLDTYGVDKDIYLDPCSGYGGRLVGFFASAYNTYIGTDPSKKSYDANSKMIDDLLPVNKNAFMYNLPFEELDLSDYKNKCDIAFTSPPYFNKETYADEETQSTQKYPEYEQWKNGFLTELIKKCYESLKNDRYFIFNIEDINVKGKRFDLVKDSIGIAQKIGFTFVKRDEFVLNTRTSVVDGKKVTTDGKESLLVFIK